MDADFALLDDDFEDLLVSDYEIQLRSPFRLFDLPPELWLRIGEFAVIREKPMVLSRNLYGVDQERIVRQPAITKTCRLLRQETLPLFYSLNEFAMIGCGQGPILDRWLVAIGEVGYNQHNL